MLLSTSGYYQTEFLVLYNTRYNRATKGKALTVEVQELVGQAEGEDRKK